MIKINNTVVQKVEKNVGGVITEIPSVVVSDKTAVGDKLVHLGYNSYYTVFNNPAIVDKGYCSLSNGDSALSTFNTLSSRLIKTWLYYPSTPTVSAIGDGVEKTVTERMTLAGGSYNYDGTHYVSELSVTATLKLYVDSGAVYCDRSYTIYRGSTAITSYSTTHVLASAPYIGVMAALGVNGAGNIPEAYIAFIDKYGAGADKISYADAERFGTQPLAPTNSEPRMAVRISGGSKIEHRVEGASWKPSNFSSYQANYFLSNIDVHAQGVSGNGSVTWSPYITWSSSSGGGVPSGGAGGAGGVMPGTSQEMY